MNTHRLLVRGTRVELTDEDLGRNYTGNNNLYTMLSKNFINIIIVGVVLIIIIILIIIFKKRKKNKGKRYKEDEE